MQRYQLFHVTYEHSVEGSDQRFVNRGTVTVYGDSELAIQAELARQHPAFTDIVILNVEAR